MAKIRPIKVAVIGLGRAGWDIHVARMRNDSRFKVTAVTDPLEDRVAQARDELGCETFRTRQALIKKADAEMIVNATPTHLHAPVSIEILKSGRHCLVEKPVSRNVAELQKVLRVAKSTGKKFFAHHNTRFKTEIKHFNEVIDSGILGEIFEIRVALTSFSRRNDWQTIKKFGGGVLVNTGVHMIDSAMQMMGAPIVDQWGDLKLISDSGDVEDHCRLLLRARNGCVADFLISTANHVTLPPWTLCGTCGTLVSSGGTSTINYFDPGKVKPLPVDPGAAAGRVYGNTDKLPWKQKTMPSASKRKDDLFDNIFEVLRQRKKMAVTPESVLEVMKVLDRLKKRPVRNMRPVFGK